LDYQTAEERIKEVISIKDKSKVMYYVVDFLFENFDKYNWVGIYLVKGNELILGPWNGPNATEHTRILVGQGICGSAAKTGKTEVIQDVNKDKRYLSCFITTKSEIVVPIKKDNKIVAEIDIDSDKKNIFTDKDIFFLQKVAGMLTEHI